MVRRRDLVFVAWLWWIGLAGMALGVEERFHVIVVGSEPEGIAAAVAAAESGARTLLVSRDARLGGLLVPGAMNVLDVRLTPVNLQRGLFERWWLAVGRGFAFDVARGERVFAALLADAGVEVRLGVPLPAPVVEAGRVVGVRLGDGPAILAEQVIDATGDADLAAAAGARSSLGFASVGLEARMADTLVFRIDGIDWDALRRGVRQRGRAYAYADERVAYGHFAGHPAAYPASTPQLRLRGLNLGRQDDGTVLVNALLIYDLDPFDAASLAAGHALAAAEVPAIVAWLAQDLPGFAAARAGAVAEALYVRQTRHLVARCILTIDHVLDNVVTDWDVAAGGYPLDVQTLRPSDDGFVFGLPDVYGARLCMAIPEGVDGLWVVGRSAGFDAIAQSSARVVPFGMAFGEAVGVAAAVAAALGLEPAEVAADAALVRDVREALASRGAYLPPVRPRAPVGPITHPRYDDYRAVLRWGLAVGGYDNDPRLDAAASRTSLLFLLSNVLQRAFGDAATGPRLVARFGLDAGPLLAAEAAEVVAAALCELERCPAGSTWDDLRRAGLPLAEPQTALRRGEVYALAVLVLEGRRPDPAAAGR